MLEELNKLLRNSTYGIVTYDEVIISNEAIYEVSDLDTIITILLIVLLIQKNQIKLDEPINTYLNDYPSDVKIIHLLTHSSGLNKNKKLFDAGTNVFFDFYNIELLDLLIRKLYCRPKEECATEFIFNPLNMVNTKYNGKKLYSSVSDLTNIIHMILHNGYFDGKNIIDSHYIDMLFTPLFISEENIRRTIGFIYGKSIVPLNKLVGDETITNESFMFLIDRTNDFGYIILSDNPKQLVSDIYRILKKYDKIY